MLWELCDYGLSLDEIFPDVQNDTRWRGRFVEAVQDLATLGFIYPHKPLAVDHAEEILAGQRQPNLPGARDG